MGKEKLSPGAALPPVPDTPHMTVITFGEISVDMLHRRVTIQGEEIPLAPKEVSLLYALLCGAGEVVPRQELREAIDATPEDNALQNQIYRLRKKLTAKGYRIVSLRGRGYALKRAAEPEEDKL